MKGRSNLLHVGRDRQTDQLGLLSLSLSSSKKRCFVDLGWLLFCLVVPIRMHFLCTPGVVLARPLATQASEQGLPLRQLLRWRHWPFLPGNSLLVGTLDGILLLLLFLKHIYIYVYMYIQAANYWAFQKKFASSLLGVKGRVGRSIVFQSPKMYEEDPRCTDLRPGSSSEVVWPEIAWCLCAALSLIRQSKRAQAIRQIRGWKGPVCGRGVGTGVKQWQNPQVPMQQVARYKTATN